MKTYDIIVIGSGGGAIISDEAVSQGLKVALVDKGPLGGTCLNVGCIPSKMLIYPADRILEIQEARKLGIEAEIRSIDFHSIMERMRQGRQEEKDQIRQGIKEQQNLDYYEAEGHFVGDYTLEVSGERIKGEKVFIASGTRPLMPRIKGLDEVQYLTNETVLELRERPDSLIIIGGGYIAVEFGHFFAAMGTRVTILEMADRLVASEEPEISHLLHTELSKRMQVQTGSQVEEVKERQGGVTAVARNVNTGNKAEFVAQKILVAVGRRPNADVLKFENTGVETDRQGFIKVNEYLQTSKKNIYAIGDANGQYMFRHMANEEALLVVQNVFYGGDLKIDYSAVPHAIFSHPQIASVGLTEEAARKKYDVLVGRTKYSDVAKGQAMMETEGFAKAVVEKGTDRILGFHIVGPYAPELIQEAVNAMASGGHIREINQGIHTHPALSELIPVTLNSLEEA
ncbi:MAG: dihydrolipoyl dehydrogenase [Chloroflexi bacterium]|nr:dihydrolipoyl dehydrogenase [Chloroflexota bacterium]